MSENEKSKLTLNALTDKLLETMDCNAVLPEHVGIIRQACKDIYHMTPAQPKLTFSVFASDSEKGVYLIRVVDVDGILAPMPSPDAIGIETRFKYITRKSGPVVYVFTVDVSEN